MKITFKLLFIILSLSLIVASFSVLGSAEDAVYTVTSAGGTVTEYTDASGFKSSFANANDGDTITLNSDIEIDSDLHISSEDELSEKTVYLNLNGHGIYANKKLNIITVGSYTKLNVYSSKPNAFLYVEEHGSASLGGNIFTVASEIGPAKLNFGTMTIGGVEYPGSNITTFASCFVQTGGETETEIYIDGGTHIANVRDWSGFICHRSSAPKIAIKNANLLISDTVALIASYLPGGEVSIEDCSILSLDGLSRPLFSQANGDVTLKNCLTNLSLTVSGSNKSPESLTLEGNNLFGSADMDESILAASENKVLAYVNDEYSFADGSDKIQCFGKFVNQDNFNLMEIKLPDVGYACAALTDKENAIEYVWRSGELEASYVWDKNHTPKVPFLLTGNAQEGLYKPGWYKVEEEGKIIYTGGSVLDFGIKVNIVYDEYSFLNIYIPAFVIDEAYLDFSGVNINGDPLNRKLWEEYEIDGEKYYRASVDISEGVEDVYTLLLSCDFGKGKYATNAWQISVSRYFEIISENEADFTEEELATVRLLEEKIFGE